MTSTTTWACDKCGAKTNKPRDLASFVGNPYSSSDSIFGSRLRSFDLCEECFRLLEMWLKVGWGVNADWRVFHNIKRSDGRVSGAVYHATVPGSGQLTAKAHPSGVVVHLSGQWDDVLIPNELVEEIAKLAGGAA